MSRIRSTALERSVIILLEGLNRFYGIPTLALGPDVVHTLSYDLRPNFSLSGILSLYHDNINKFVEYPLTLHFANASDIPRLL